LKQADIGIINVSVQLMIEDDETSDCLF